MSDTKHLSHKMQQDYINEIYLEPKYCPIQFYYFFTVI